jgi:ATP-dependent HslUV protease, peptidase subunit HslV
MSTVVVVRKNGIAAIAADSLTTYGSTKLPQLYARDKDKILTFNNNYIGIVGSTAHNIVLRSIIRKHPELLCFNSKNEIFESYLQLHPMLKEKYFLNPMEKDESQDYESSHIDALIANDRGIFGMFSWREIYEYDRFWAIGSGREFALGAMHALYERVESAAEIAAAGVAAGGEFDDSSSMPMTIYTIALAEPVAAMAAEESEKPRKKGKKEVNK